MSGVTWNERQPGDWLASNGRWYPESQRPRRWPFLSLPPAPGHGRFVTRSQGATEFADASGAQSSHSDADEPRSSSWASNRAQDVSTEVVRTGRRVADATVTNSKTFKRRIDPSHRAAGELPAPGPSAGQGSQSPPPPPKRTPPPPGRTVAKDFGKVVGQARKKIEQAINEAATEQ